MRENFSPQRWANTLTMLLNSVHGAAAERFPVRVPDLAKEYSRHRFPDDPVSLVAGDKVVVKGHPMRDGRTAAALVSVEKSATGEVLSQNPTLRKPAKVASN